MTTTWMPEWTLADRLRKIRRDQRLSQEKFAELLGVKHPTYGAWEAGRNSPDQVVDLARRVEAITGVPAAWTLGVYAETPRPDGPAAASVELVRHQGLEPRTRWFGRSGERRGFMPIADPTGRRHRRRYVVAPLAAVQEEPSFEFSDNQVAELPHPRQAAETTAAFRWAA